MARNKRITGAGFQIVIASGTVMEKIKEAVLTGLEEVSEQYYKAVLENLSLDDHTLAELQALGHPYSVNAPRDGLHGDDRLVHEQSGKLKSSIKKGMPEESTSRRFSVYVTSSDPVMPWLIYGTATMRKRNFPEKAYEDIKPKFWEPVFAKLRKLEYRMETSVTQRS